MSKFEKLKFLKSPKLFEAALDWGFGSYFSSILFYFSGFELIILSSNLFNCPKSAKLLFLFLLFFIILSKLKSSSSIFYPLSHTNSFLLFWELSKWEKTLLLILNSNYSPCYIMFREHSSRLKGYWKLFYTMLTLSWIWFPSKTILLLPERSEYSSSNLWNFELMVKLHLNFFFDYFIIFPISSTS